MRIVKNGKIRAEVKQFEAALENRLHSVNTLRDEMTAAEYQSIRIHCCVARYYLIRFVYCHKSYSNTISNLGRLD